MAKEAVNRKRGLASLKVPVRMGYSSHSLLSITLKAGDYGEEKDKKQVAGAAAVTEKPNNALTSAHRQGTESDDGTASNTRKRKAEDTSLKRTIETRSRSAGMNQVWSSVCWEFVMHSGLGSEQHATGVAQPGGAGPALAGPILILSLKKIQEYKYKHSL